MQKHPLAVILCYILLATIPGIRGFSQVPPSAQENASYTGFFRAAALGDIGEISRLLSLGLKPDGRDAHGRTPLHVAAYAGQREAMRALVGGGADPNALENDRYDVVTIAAVADDLLTLETALAGRRSSSPSSWETEVRGTRRP